MVKIKQKSEIRKIILSLIGMSPKEGVKVLAEKCAELERDALRWKVAKEVHDIDTEAIDAWIK